MELIWFYYRPGIFYRYYLRKIESRLQHHFYQLFPSFPGHAVGQIVEPWRRNTNFIMDVYEVVSSTSVCSSSHRSTLLHLRRNWNASVWKSGFEWWYGNSPEQQLPYVSGGCFGLVQVNYSCLKVVESNIKCVVGLQPEKRGKKLC